MILNQPPVWNKDAAALLRQFLESPVGQLTLAHLAASRPALTAPSLESTAMQANLAAGHEHAIRFLLFLSEPLADPTRGLEETYPPLDDDRHWENPVNS